MYALEKLMSSFPNVYPMLTQTDFLGGNLGYSGYFPYGSNQEAFLVQLLSFTKFTKHPGFVPIPGQYAKKRGLVKTRPGHQGSSCHVASVRKAVCSSPVVRQERRRGRFLDCGVGF